jgi:hypothetical protein
VSCRTWPVKVPVPPSKSVGGVVVGVPKLEPIEIPVVGLQLTSQGAAYGGWSSCF